jgi:hypothetical protein
MKLPTLTELDQAADLVYSTMLPSPQLEWPLLNERCGCRRCAAGGPSPGKVA